MSELDTQNINVLNYNENEVFVDSAKEHYKFNASRDGKTPSVIPMSLSELQNICSNTDVVITGWLTFDDDVKEEIFKELRIPNWREILTNEDIKEILTHPTIDSLQRIINIENQTYFDRVRMVMFKLMNNGVDITTKVSRIVEQRYDELRKRQRKSSIVLTEKDTHVNSDDVKKLSEQNAQLKSQIDEMKEMMAQLMSMQNMNKSKVENNNDSDSNDSPASNVEHKRPGRPKKIK